MKPKSIFIVLTFSFYLLLVSFLHSQETWVKTYQPFYNPNGDNDYYVEDVLVCDDGGYAVNGYYWYFDDWIEEQWGYLMKTDSDGNFLWAKKDTVSWISETESSAFVQTDDSGFLSAVYSLWGGTALIKRDADGNREWVENCGDLYIHSMDKTNDGNIILGGRMNGLPATRKITQNAEIIWTQDYYIQGSSSGCIKSIISLTEDSYAVTGWESGNGGDIFVLKTDEDGDSLWTQTFDGYGYFDESFCLIENTNEEIYVSGYFRQSNRIIYGVLIKLTNNGDVIFILSEFNSDNDYGFRSMLDNSSNIIGYGRGNLYAYSYDGDSLWISDLTGNSGRGDKCLGIINDGFICSGEIEINWDDYVLLTKTDSEGNVTSIDNNEMLHIETTLSCFPNPFNPMTQILFSLEDKGIFNLTIYNVKGQKIRTLKKGYLNKGKYDVIWDGKDDNNKQVASGVYLYRLSTGKKTLNKKMLLLK